MVQPHEDFPEIGEREIVVDPAIQEVMLQNDVFRESIEARLTEAKVYAEQGVTSTYDDRREAYLFCRALVNSGDASTYLEPGESLAKTTVEAEMFAASSNFDFNAIPFEMATELTAKLTEVLRQLHSNVIPTDTANTLHSAYLNSAVMVTKVAIEREVNDPTNTRIAIRPKHNANNNILENQEVLAVVKARATERGVTIDEQIADIVKSCALAAMEVEASFIASRILLTNSLLAGLPLLGIADSENDMLHVFARESAKNMRGVLHHDQQPGEKIFYLTETYKYAIATLKPYAEKTQSNPVLSKVYTSVFNDKDQFLNMVNNRATTGRWQQEFFPIDTPIAILPNYTGESAAEQRERAEELARIEDERQQLIEEKCSELLDKANDLVVSHDALLSHWQASRKKLKELGLQDVMRDMLVGIEGKLPGSTQEEVLTRLAIIAHLHSFYYKEGYDEALELMNITLDAEASGLKDTSRYHEIYRSITSENGFPKYNDTFTQSINWIKGNWTGIEYCFDQYSDFGDVNDALSHLLNLERTKEATPQPETTVHESQSMLNQEEQAEFDRLVAEEAIRTAAEHEAYVRMLEEENERRAAVEAEEAQILADLEAEEAQRARFTQELELETIAEASDTTQSIGEVAIGMPTVELLGIAEELEFEVFPPGASMEQIKTAATRINPNQDKTDWDRIRDLKLIADQADGQLYISRGTLSSGRKPYYVAVFSIANETIAVAENPVYGNASYIIREALVPGTWQEILQLPKPLARQVGASQTVHRTQKDHVQKIRDRIQRLLTIKAYQPTLRL